MPDSSIVFIHHTNPSKRIADKETRRKIASHVGTTINARKRTPAMLHAPARALIDRRLSVRFPFPTSRTKSKKGGDMEDPKYYSIHEVDGYQRRQLRLADSLVEPDRFSTIHNLHVPTLKLYPIDDCVEVTDSVAYCETFFPPSCETLFKYCSEL
jgi:hypothetical protein